MCFFNSYKINPNLVPVTTQQLHLICDSRKLDASAKDSFGSFKACAVENWEPSLGIELDRINAARESCTKNHDHSKKDPVVSLSHDEVQLSMINEVVNKVFEGAKGVGANKTTDIKMIDFSGNVSTPKPIPISASAVTKELETNKAALNDPNTVMVLIDDSKAGKSGPGVITNAVAAAASAISTPAPVVAASTSKPAANSTTSVTATVSADNKSNHTLQGKILSAVSTTAAPKVKVEVSVKSTSAGTSTTTASPKETSHSPNVTKKAAAISVSIATSTTSAPNHSTSKPVSSTKAPATAAAATSSTTKPNMSTKAPAQPIETLKKVLDNQDKQLSALEKKLKAEREKVISQLKRKQDEEDSKKAIKSLQLQREASHNSAADARLHHIEHERQMSIDPIGHSIKHQQFEMNKQKKSE